MSEQTSSNLATIWFCEDLYTPGDSGFATTKREAEGYVSGNRGYDNYDGSKFKACARDGWAKPAIRIEVLPAVKEALLEQCKA